MRYYNVIVLFKDIYGTKTVLLGKDCFKDFSLVNVLVFETVKFVCLNHLSIVPE